MKQRADGRWAKKKMINGKAVFFYSTAKTEKAAVRDIDNQMLAYAEKEEKGKTFAEVAEEWQQTAKYEGLSPTTKKRYDILLNHARKEFADDYIKQITADEIEIFLMQKVDEGKAAKTIKHQFSIFRLLFKYAKMKRYIANDETEYVVIPDGKKEVKRRAVTEAEAQIIKDNINSDFGLFAYFIMNTGLRRGEALALTCGDLDFENKIITIDKSAYYVGNQPKLKTPKTQAGFRKIIFPDCLVDAMKKYRTKNKDEYVFHYPHEPTKMHTADTYERLWDKYQRQTGLTDVTAHMLRHTYATLLFEKEICQG